MTGAPLFGRESSCKRLGVKRGQRQMMEGYVGVQKVLLKHHLHILLVSRPLAIPRHYPISYF